MPHTNVFVGKMSSLVDISSPKRWSEGGFILCRDVQRRFSSRRMVLQMPDKRPPCSSHLVGLTESLSSSNTRSPVGPWPEWVARRLLIELARQTSRLHPAAPKSYKRRDPSPSPFLHFRTSSKSGISSSNNNSLKLPYHCIESDRDSESWSPTPPPRFPIT
jgi:hypothetical protein